VGGSQKMAGLIRKSINLRDDEEDIQDSRIMGWSERDTEAVPLLGQPQEVEEDMIGRHR
jgi:hypothetical protein